MNRINQDVELFSYELGNYNAKDIRDVYKLVERRINVLTLSGKLKVTRFTLSNDFILLAFLNSSGTVERKLEELKNLDGLKFIKRGRNKSPYVVLVKK